MSPRDRPPVDATADARARGDRAHSATQVARDRRRGQAAAARLAARRHRPADPRRRHRADRAVPRRRRPGSARRSSPASALLLFTVSAIYHRGTWSPRVWAFLRRFDHANIFLLIAGTYTPFTPAAARRHRRGSCCSRSSGPARCSGVLFRVFWTDAPRWLYMPIYIALGWAAVFFFPAFFDGADGSASASASRRR